MERMSKIEFRTWLENRTRVFAVAVLKALDALPKKLSTKVVANQLGRSATSITRSRAADFQESSSSAKTEARSPARSARIPWAN